MKTILVMYKMNTKKTGKSGKFHKLEILPKHINSLLIYLIFFSYLAFNLKRPQEMDHLRSGNKYLSIQIDVM